MFEILKSEIAQIEKKESPNLSMFWGTNTNIERAVPQSLFKPRMRGYIKRAARMLFLSEVCGRTIQSTKEMYGMELWAVDAWISGTLGEDEDREVNEILNIVALCEWWIEHKAEIHALAEKIKQERKKK